MLLVGLGSGFIYFPAMEELLDMDWEDRLDEWELELDLTAQLEGSDWVTLERAAADTGASRAALRSWYRTGQIPSRLVDGPHGPQRLVPLAVLAARAEASPPLRSTAPRRPGIHSHLPGGAGRAEAGRHREPDGIAVRVDQEDEVRVGDPLAARAGLGDRIPVHADSQGLRISGIPVIAVHLVAGRGEPDYVALAIAGIARLAAEEPAAPEDGMRPAQRRQGRDELDQVGVLRSSVPVDPGDLVVLAVAVVVALLGSAELVTGQQHRDALGEEQRHEEVPDLPFPQRVDLRVVGRPFGAAVP